MFQHWIFAFLLGFLVRLSLQQETALHLRNSTDFNPGWLFHYGDTSNAHGASLPDSSWRALSVPHDWAIEGPNPPASPFASGAPTTGYGGYVPSGIGWYRKHFSLAGTPVSRKIYIEFDGVMQDASVYVNGALIGTHPYGYTSFRYDITSAVKFTGDNVLAVKTDTSRQPGERFYKGAGIYRDVRLISTSSVHIDQYGLYVTTPAVTTSAATVYANVTVINNGNITSRITVQAVLSGPDGGSFAPVTAAARTIVPDTRATFTLEVPVSNPRLWSLDNPNLYSIMATVSVDDQPADVESTTVGIRRIDFSATTGMSLNGRNIKFQGVCLHQDYHSLGLAVPKRAMQRRLTQLKALGVNSIRTSHDPPSPAFLELTDRMGFLVLNEFFDVWMEHKYSNVGDYATHFNQIATSPTGNLPVPGATGPVPWFQVDVTSVVTRDRNHPSVAMYSVGNEIHDSIKTRTPLLKRMKEIVNVLDPGRAITQALLRPADSGDIKGETRTNLDVFGANYREAEVLDGMKMSPARAGLITEETKEIKQWDSVKQNAALTGLFLWTGVDHLGEADKAWPKVGATPGLLDAVGGMKPSAYEWQKVWGAPQTPAPASGTTASRIILAAEQTSVSTDVNDISYVKATVVDASGKVVTGSSATINFSIAGPGIIVAVDSGSQAAETFRGNQRKAYQGIAYALVRATGEGKIMITAASGDFIAGTTTLIGIMS
jgi:beta-galactosidase